MLKRAKSWFIHLSRTGKIGAIGAAAFCLFIVASAMATPPIKQLAQDCKASTASQTETQSIPFDKSQANDPNLDKGKTVVTTTGVDGEKTLTNKVTKYTPEGCKASSTTFVKEETTKQPVAEVTSIGTKVPAPPPAPTPAPAATQQSSCSPYYSPCVPNVSYDLDCSDIGMRVSVHGGDPYRLDADHDGIGCESY